MFIYFNLVFLLSKKVYSRCFYTFDSHSRKKIKDINIMYYVFFYNICFLPSWL